MLGDKIRNVRNSLGVLADKVNEGVWAYLKVCQAELTDAADAVEEIERAVAMEKKPIPAATPAK
ncbi:hypothetical protein G3N56_06020 [Desulfovibrio sulfodismutans]|uniref:Uncharacterized protein n=1 Tax=Desulfolutivibrio sulfodismutans TaxID=63561 RepID=A0A7K3NJC6_9BACT|nr:hypothetical protein [Desulfolutivibrio sulfodismutans]NDY56301.1 hypothetical protein [Desulfolutivibrio sulfodismutans]QLA13572.1 hypothetical protein GD606_15520 [Desulfolutivibrio sulfodismutans DSM 3696]